MLMKKSLLLVILVLSASSCAMESPSCEIEQRGTKRPAEGLPSPKRQAIGITLVSNDGQEFTVSKALIEPMETLTKMIQVEEAVPTLGEPNKIFVPNLSGNILNKVIQFAHRYSTIPLKGRALFNAIADFLGPISPDEALELLKAGDYLEYQPLIYFAADRLSLRFPDNWQEKISLDLYPYITKYLYLNHGVTDVRELNITAEVFTPEELKTMDVMRLSFSVRELMDYRGLPPLSDDKVLNLSDMLIGDLDGLNDIPGAAAIASIVLDNNKLKKIPANAFVAYPNLLYLSLRSNDIDEIDGGAFNGADALGNLNLSNNKLTQIPQELFKGKEDFVKLLLSSNRFTTLPDFSQMPHLAQLDLSYNLLTTITSLSNSLGELVNLDLSANKIDAIEDDSFEPLKNLGTLDLSKNRLRIITTDTLWGLDNLEYLYLDHNAITIIAADAFADFNESLEQLTLSYNQLRNLPNGLLDGMFSLTSLRIDHNKLMQLSNQLNDLDALELLEAQRNLFDDQEKQLIRAIFANQEDIEIKL